MTLLRTAAVAVLSTLSAFVVASASGCGSDAVGVDACRDIENARCEAGQYCGFVDDVDQCKRFYRDQCLHGIESGKEPGDIALRNCINAIKTAGDCAKAGTAELASCAAWTFATTKTTACDAVQFPEEIKLCEFLREDELDAGVPTEAGADSSSDGASDAASDTSADAPASD